MMDVAIVGAGLMGRWHLAAAQAAGARVTVIVDRDRELARRLARKAPAAAAVADITELTDGAARAVHICLPTHLHASAVHVALSKRMAALVEKPMAKDAAETQQLYAAAERLGLLVCPVHQYAFQVGVERTLANLPRLGALLRIEFDIRSAGADGGLIAPNQLIADILPHPLSVLQRLKPDIDLAQLQWAMKAAPGDLLAIAQHGRVMLVLRVSASARPTCFRTLVVGDRGSAEIDGFHGYVAFSTGEASRANKLGAPFKEAMTHIGAASANLARRAIRREFAYPGLIALTKKFYAAVAHGSGAPIAPRAAVENALARDRFCGLLQGVEVT